MKTKRKCINMLENLIYHDDACRFVKRAFKLAFGFVPRCPDVYFTFADLGDDGSYPFLEFIIGGRSYRLVVTDSTTSYFHERNYHLTIFNAYGHGHDCYMSFSEPYKTRI